MRVQDRERDGAGQGNGEHAFVLGRFEEPEQNDVDEYQYNRVVQVNRVGDFAQILKRLAAQHLRNDAGRARKNDDTERENEREHQFP